MTDIESITDEEFQVTVLEHLGLDGLAHFNRSGQSHYTRDRHIWLD